MRVKRGVASHRKHNKIRSQTKGMTLANRSSIKRGRQASIKALQYSYRDRRNKKRTFRSIWTLGLMLQLDLMEQPIVNSFQCSKGLILG